MLWLRITTRFCRPSMRQPFSGSTSRTSMETPWKVIVAFIGVFVAGAIFGGVFTLGAGKRARVEAQVSQAPPPQVVQQQTPPAPNSSSATEPPKPAAKAAGITPGLMRDLTKRLS